MRFIITVLLGLAGGALFTYFNTPIPWMLGPLTAVMLIQSLTPFQVIWPLKLKNIGLIVLGMSFGLYFTVETMTSIGPYLLPYLLFTVLIILLSVVQSLSVTKWIDVDRVSSVFGSIPGGLTEMVIASESLNGNTAHVMVFQTIRLLLVLFAVPFVIMQIFDGSQNGAAITVAENNIPFISWSILWFLLPFLAGWRYYYLLPAGWIVLPMLVTAGLNMSPAALPSIPDGLFLAAQAAVGLSLGKQIFLQDIKNAGRYGLIYGGLAVILIVISLLLGWLLAVWTGMDTATALLSTAPGGLVEMVLTATMVGADPAIVTSMQLLRILLIIIFVPAGLGWYFRRTASTE